MQHLFYRNATLQDLPGIVSIYNSTIPSRMATADTAPVSVESKLDWFNQHLSNKRPLWIIEDEQKNIVGWLSFQSFYGRPAYDSTAEISIYLDEAHRGKGIGKLALRHAVASAPRLGLKTLLGFIFTHNYASLKLFEQEGFEAWGTLPNVAVLDGKEHSVTIMGKRVG